MIFITPPAKALKSKLLDITSDKNSVDSDLFCDSELIMISGAFKNSMRSVAPAVCSGNLNVLISAVILGTRLQGTRLKERKLFYHTYNA